MIMEKQTKPLIIFVSLLFSLFFFFFPLSQFSLPFLLTIPIALLSTLFLVTFMRKKKGSQEEEEEEEDDDDLLQTEELFHNEQEAESQSDSSFPSDSEEKIELNAMNSSIPSDSESFNGSNLSESFELDQNSTRILGFYESLESESHNDEEDDDDDDDDDEDGLIEINFPSSHFSDLIKENEEKLESKFPDFLREDMFKQEGLMELLEEINEDESLIEIDISMGFSGDQCVVLSD